jgi:hypothetical protein
MTLTHVNQCLSLLEFCGVKDQAARSFQQKLTVAYDIIVRNDLKTSITSPLVAGLATTAPNSIPDTVLKLSNSLFIFPPTGLARKTEQSLRILKMICTPCGETSLKKAPQENINFNQNMQPPSFEYSWYCKTNGTFHWNLESSDSSNKTTLYHFSALEDTTKPKHMFLGSRTPSGWRSAGEFMKFH